MQNPISTDAPKIQAVPTQESIRTGRTCVCVCVIQVLAILKADCWIDLDVDAVKHLSCAAVFKAHPSVGC